MTMAGGFFKRHKFGSAEKLNAMATDSAFVAKTFDH